MTELSGEETRDPRSQLFDRLVRLNKSGGHAAQSASVPNEAGMLVPLRPGNGRPPLYVFPATDGSVGYLRNLARYAPDGMPVFGLPSPGLVESERNCESIEEIAETAIDAIRSHQPHGPYFLAGYCMGGLPLFETAKRLEAGGHVVEAAIHVTPVMERDWDDLNAEADRNMRAIKDYLDIAALTVGKPIDFDVEALRPLGKAPRLERVVEFAHAEGLLDERVRVEDLGHRFEVYEKNLEAMLSYAPKGTADSFSVLFAGPGATAEKFYGRNLCYSAYSCNYEPSVLKLECVDVDDSAILTGSEPDLAAVGEVFNKMIAARL